MIRIDMENWPRRHHYALYGALEQPHFSLCAAVDITALVPYIKSQKASLFSALLYAVTREANALPELRQRIRGTEVVEHFVIHPSFTVLGEDNLFGFCLVEYTPDWITFAARVAEGIAAARAHPNLEDEPRDDMLFISSIPWVSFTGMVHPVAGAADSFPRISWGKYTEEQGRIRIPFSVQCHHALVDGLHVGRLFGGLQAAFDTPESYYGG